VPGLYHVAFEVGETSDDLAAARRDAVAHGLKPFGETVNSFSISIPTATRSSSTWSPRASAERGQRETVRPSPP